MLSSIFTSVSFTIAISYLLTSPNCVFGQDNLLHVEGGLTISDVNAVLPDPGTIRFNQVTLDFEGWNGQHWLSLTRLREAGAGVVDLDNNLYPSIKLGTQEWMTKNLRTTKYNDGTDIPEVSEPSEWSALTTGAWSWHDNVSGYDATYGKLYNFYAIETGKLCPTGWHVPTDAERSTLAEYLGGIEVAGGKMKEVGNTYWNDPNTEATNESDFTGRPGGTRNSAGSFFSLGTRGIFWTSTESSSTSAKLSELVHDDGKIHFTDRGKKDGASIRCVKD